MKSDATHRPFPNTPEQWEALIADAPGEDRPLTPEEEAQWADAIVVHEGGYPAVKAALAERRRTRGPQKAPTKVPTTIRFDADVLEGLRATGKGWQTRVNDAMREWLRTHSA